MRRDVFHGIADPTRREILNMIAHKSLNVNAVSGKFSVSRTAIYKHVKILTECGLVVVKQQGRERYCVAQLKKLNEVAKWVARYRELWKFQFGSLDEYLRKLKKTSKKRSRKKAKDKKL